MRLLSQRVPSGCPITRGETLRRRTRAAAAATAGLLLIGGAGTLSYWTDTEITDGIELATGEITLSPFECDPDGWTFADGDPLVDGEQIVPGDVVSKSCSFDVTMEGDNARAALELTDAPIFLESNDFTVQLTPTATYSIDGEPVPAELDDENNGDTVDVDLSVVFSDLGDPRILDQAALADPLQNQNLTNGADLTATLDAITVVIRQQV
ncbi:alternate-type signal peptide domain-containing protein [Nocardioidaceae bacterium]|nr:alternate-type signal peptide domain-containing protein [Nocardioidaceae bacterium]